MPSATYPKRLIEVDLPIKKISEHARREKSIRHGHISTLHIWWARRPLAACRAVICAALWPDPADPLCPESFKIEAKKQMGQFWNKMDASARNLDDPIELRRALLDFIADFSNWDNTSNEHYITTARHLVQTAHESLGGEHGTKPLVIDPFAGGGSIPLEALRVGADAYASDINPVAVMLNKVVLEYIPKYGQDLANEVRKWGKWVKEEAEKELQEYYQKDSGETIPIAYLWARTIRCEGPGCGAEVPLIRSLWLAKKGDNSVALRIIPKNELKKVDFEIIQFAKPKDVKDGTVRKSSATCPCCDYTTPVASVRKQLKLRHGGADDARMIAVRYDNPRNGKRSWRIAEDFDINSFNNAKKKWNTIKDTGDGKYSTLPNEPYPDESGAGAISSSVLYGIKNWGDLFNSRQALSMVRLSELVSNAPLNKSEEFNIAIRSCLALAVDRMADFNASLCVLNSVGGRGVVHVFGRQALPMVWDYMETNPFNTEAANWETCYEVIYDTIQKEKINTNVGTAIKANAIKNPLPDDIANAIITDPPYYDAIAYGDLSDFFYVWLHRTIGKYHPDLFTYDLVDKSDEIVQLSKRFKGPYAHKTKEYFENSMKNAVSESKRLLKHKDIAVIVFAHKTTSGWEALIQALIGAGWIITASWPIDTERPGRMNAMGTASLASSVHLVCRPREILESSIDNHEIGEWSDILVELPLRIREWMPRLKQENVVGADAIFACLGPALEIFSRYSRVEKASGEQVTLKEYLEKVWEAVENEALKVIFEGADASGFEEDARLTAMWLWTLKASTNGESSYSAAAIDEETEDNPDETSLSAKPAKIVGYSLEYDAARKISQGLGAHPEEMPTLIEIKKGNARLLSVAERAPYLFGKEEVVPKRKAKKRDAQLTLFPGEAVAEEPAGYGSLGELSTIGKTILDRVHQSMLLFGNGQSDELKRFLVEDGVGKDPQFKKLAQALVALYPTGSDEKRWAEGVMSRMKGLGL